MTAARKLALFAWIVMALLALSAQAHEGHDDAASPGVPIAAGGVPRFEAVSDMFEIVGIVDKGSMTLFLDRYATNDPVANAKLDIEAGAAKGPAQVNPDGTYTFRHAALAAPCQFPVTIAVAAGSDADLLTGELVIPDPNASNGHAETNPNWKQLAWIAGVLILTGAITMTAWRYRRHRFRKDAK